MIGLGKIIIVMSISISEPHSSLLSAVSASKTLHPTLSYLTSYEKAITGFRRKSTIKLMAPIDIRFES
jgi:hypothetical protein